MICRVDPESGRTRKPTHILKLQAWADLYEKKTLGRLLIPNREQRRRIRQSNAKEIRAAARYRR